MVVASPLVSGKWSLKKINATVVNGTELSFSTLFVTVYTDQSSSDIWPETLFFTLIAAMVAGVTERTEHKLGISNSLITVLGMVLGLVISFRTSSAYERYQDGRRLWTNIAIASRNLAQLLWIHVSPERIKKSDDVDAEHIRRERLKAIIEKRTMINLIQAFAVSVKHFLRGEAGIYYQDLYPLIAFLPRHYVDSADPTDHDTLPMWADHEKLVESARSTPSSTLSHNHSHKKTKPRSDYFDPEKALPHVISEIPLQPARNPPHATIYDHIPFLIIFKPFILIPKWIFKKYLRRNEHANIEAGTGTRTLTGKKKAPAPITSNVPLEITLYLHSYVQFLLAKPGLIQPAIATGLITNLGLLQDTVNNLERVQTTPIPFAYQAHLRMSLWLYLAFLPFQVVSTMGWWTIPGTCFASFLLLGFLEIGQEIENPFNYDENDLDLDKFCLAIQRELHEVTAHPTPDPHFYVFSQFNRPFAPSDDRTAQEILSDVNHEYHTHSHAMDPIRRTLLRNWRQVQQVTHPNVIMKRATDRGSTSPQRGPPHTKKPRLDDSSQEVDANSESQQQHNNDTPPMEVFTKSMADDGWTKVEKRKSKKAKKYEVRVSNNAPTLNYSTTGITARKEPISIGDIRDLVIHLVGDGPPQPWLKIMNPNSIQKVVVAQVPGLTNSILNLPPLPTDPTMNPYLPIPISPPSTTSTSSPSIPFITQTFHHALPTRAPGEATKMHSVLGAFFMGPVSGEEKKRRILSRIEEGRKLIGEKNPSCYVLSAEEMCNQEYPIPSYMGDVSQLEVGWVESPEEDEPMPMEEEEEGMVKQLPKVFALDCEMCLTEDGKELTRVCVIEFYTEKVVLDELVKPIKPILDYLTRFSGITAEHLASVTTTLPLIQAKLVKMLTSRTILVGHSLEQDLKALKFAHARCIDTAVLYHHPRGRPLKPGLAWLTKKWCNREIQTGGEGGHDPEEDARACLELVKKKLANGPAFGEFKIDQESILERLARSTTRGPQSVIKTAVVDYGNPSTWHGAKATIAIACKSDSDILNGMAEAVGQCDLVFGRFMELSEALGWSTSKTQIAEPPSTEDALSSLDARLKALHHTLPPRTALILFSGHSDPRTMASLSQRKAKFENDLRSGVAPDDIPKEERWTSSDARALEEETAKARRGLAFLCLKREY